MKNEYIDYKPVAVPGPQIEVAELSPYQGLDALFDRALNLKTPQRDAIVMMLAELDSGLKAQESGDAAGAVRHHKFMLNFAKAGLKDAPAEAAAIFTDVTSGIKTGQPWGQTLAAIVENYKAVQRAETNLSLMPAGETAYVVNPPRRESRNDFFAFRFNEEAQKPSGSTAWTRQEYKNLGIVLEQLSKPGQPARVDAMVALSHLRTMNAQETAYLSDQRNGVKNDGAKNEAYTGARKGLKTAIGKLAANGKIGSAAIGVDRWQKPVFAYAQRFERVSQGPGVLAKIFHAAANFFNEHILPKKPAPAAPKKEPVIHI